MFDIEDFDNDDFEFQNIDDDDSFLQTLMVVTHTLKNTSMEDPIKAGHHLMMKIFNMTGLEALDKNEQALNVLLAVFSHLFAFMTDRENLDEYFDHFDKTVIYPLLKGEE